MADSLSIAPVSLSGLTGTLPVASPAATSARTTPDVQRVAAGADGVELSATGQLLSAVSTFRTTLQALPTTAGESAPEGPATAATATAATASTPPASTPTASTSPANTSTAGDIATAPAATPAATPTASTTAIATAQSLVEAFNALLDSADAVPAIAAPLPGADLASQLTQALNALTTTSAELISLQTIGIEPLLAPTPPATASGTALQLDPATLGAAVAADPAATQAVLTGATQAFIDFAGEFEATVIAPLAPPLTPPLLGEPPAAPAAPVDSGALPAVPAPPELAGIDVAIAVPGAPAANPPAADLVIPPAAPAPTADTPLATEASANDARLAALLNAGRPPAGIPTAVATPALGTPTPLAPAVPPTTGTAATSPAAVAPASTPTVTPAVVATATVPVTPAVAAADAMAAEQRAAAATQALQIQLTDPRRRAIANQLDPAYSAVIAATHLSDFVAPRPVIEPKALANDTVGPVSALVRARAIASYAEEAAAGEIGLRRIIGTSTTRQYWV